MRRLLVALARWAKRHRRWRLYEFAGNAQNALIRRRRG